MAAGILHLDRDGRPFARFAGQRQADIQKVSKGMATCPTDRALHGALQLPCEHVTHDASAPAASILPSLLSLCTHRALSSQLLVGRHALHHVCFSLHINVSTKSAAAQRHVATALMASAIGNSRTISTLNRKLPVNGSAYQGRTTGMASS